MDMFLLSDVLVGVKTVSVLDFVPAIKLERLFIKLVSPCQKHEKRFYFDGERIVSLGFFACMQNCCTFCLVCFACNEEEFELTISKVWFICLCLCV